MRREKKELFYHVSKRERFIYSIREVINKLALIFIRVHSFINAFQSTHTQIIEHCLLHVIWANDLSDTYMINDQFEKFCNFKRLWHNHFGRRYDMFVVVAVVVGTLSVRHQTLQIGRVQCLKIAKQKNPKN